MNLIFTAFATLEGYREGSNANLGSEVFYRCIVVSLVSAKQKNQNCDAALVTNTAVPEPYAAQLSQAGIRVIACPFDNYRFEADLDWSLAYYKLCAMQYLLETEHYENGHINVGKAVGSNGTLYVVRDYGTGEPYTGVVELVSGEIAEDITSYYANSEQIPTVCALGVLLDKQDGALLLAGGMLIQLLPGATQDICDKLEANIKKLESVTTMMAKGMAPLDMCRAALEGFELEVLDEMPVHYYCTCSRQRVEQSFASIPDDQLRGMINSTGNVEAVCHYCNKKYLFTAKEIEDFIKERKERSKAK